MKHLLISGAALMAGTAALAQTAPVAPPAAPAPMARPMADRVMTRDEVVTTVRNHFSRMDADRNGTITAQEMTDGRARQGEHRRAMRVGRGEGGQRRAGRVEQRDPNAAFDRLDADKNGWIGRDEFAKAHEKRIEKRVEIREKRRAAAADGKGPGQPQFFGRRMGGLGSGRMIVMADANRDGQITLVEAQAKALEHFDRMDSNRDGQVTPEERRTARPAIIKKIIEDKNTAS